MEEEIKKQEEWHHVVTVEDLGSLQRKLHVVYDSKGVDMAFDKACDMVSKRVQIKGFRKGKAPKPLVKNHCQDQIKTTASTLLANEGFLHACFEQKIQPLGEPQVEDANFDVDGTFSCDIFVEVKPTITPTGYVGIQLKKPEISVETLFNNLLEGAKSQYASIVEKEEIEEGNTVEVDFEAKCGEDEVAAGKGHQFEINSGMEEPFGENLLGMKVGETRQANYLIPENFRQHAGEQAVVNITLKKVTTKVPPTEEELTERMQASSYEELLNLMRQQAEIEASNRARQSLEELAVDKLLEIHDFEVPEKWVNEEIQYMIKQFGIQAEGMGDEFQNYIKKMAERNVRRTFILDAIYDAEPTLQITKEEVDELVKQEAERTGLSTITIKDRLKKKHVIDSVLGMMRQRKVMEMVLSQAQILTEDSSSEESVSTEIPENPLG